jgi:hypothetical protein
MYSLNALSISSLSFLADPVLSITNFVHSFQSSLSIEIDVFLLLMFHNGKIPRQTETRRFGHLES